MANTPAPAGALAQQSHSHVCNQPRMYWIKRRARRLQQFFLVSRREALKGAVLDFDAFNPAAIK